MNIQELILKERRRRNEQGLSLEFDLHVDRAFLREINDHLRSHRFTPAEEGEPFCYLGIDIVLDETIEGYKVCEYESKCNICKKAFTEGDKTVTGLHARKGEYFAEQVTIHKECKLDS